MLEDDDAPGNGRRHAVACPLRLVVAQVPDHRPGDLVVDDDGVVPPQPALVAEVDQLVARPGDARRRVGVGQHLARPVAEVEVGANGVADGEHEEGGNQQGGRRLRAQERAVTRQSPALSGRRRQCPGRAQGRRPSMRSRSSRGRLSIARRPPQPEARASPGCSIAAAARRGSARRGS